MHISGVKIKDEDIEGWERRPFVHPHALKVPEPIQACVPLTEWELAWDVFKAVMCFVDKMGRKKESLQSCLECLRLYKVSLSDESKNFCPTSYYALKLFINRMSPIKMLHTVSYDVCPNDCVIFRANLEDAMVCPNCEEDRHGPFARKFIYIPYQQRIRRWLASPAWSKLLEHSQNRVPPPDGVITDVFDGSCYKRLFGPDKALKVSKYNNAWTLGADGIIVIKDTDYSVVPVLLTCETFSPILRRGRDTAICCGFIPGRGKNNEEVFLRLLLDEMEKGWHGYWCYDVLASEWCLCRDVILKVVVDTRGLAGITNATQHPCATACHKCDLVGQNNVNNTAVYMTGGCLMEPGSLLALAAHACRVPQNKVTYFISLSLLYFISLSFLCFALLYIY